ncbi:hypothetical protein J7T55_014346 [Diaporthe amygdali]|uniref:uncharacterized protein n=1 Tax=Phomopsis amygdali TaxID=1214568 RepID=UPI0022FDBA2F|nr:uncharacterized protein J7T55_014346 [Diaporthe amygdali]KAJ0117896.1 hypothetical protein J7T55_014346 [Diaporthe amygdali]
MDEGQGNKEEYIYTYMDEDEYIDTDTDEEECNPTDTYEQEYIDIDKDEKENIEIDKDEKENIDIDKDEKENIDIDENEQGYIDTSTDEEEYRASEQEYIDTDFDDEEYFDPRADDEESIYIDFEEEEYFSTDTEDTQEVASMPDLDDDLYLALSEMISNLCSTCRQFPRGRISETDKRLYHPSLSSLKESVDAGCIICEDLAREVSRWSEPGPTPNDLWSIRCELLSRDKKLLMRFYLSNCEECDPSDAGYTALRTTTAKSAASISMCQYWYQQCLEHTTCRTWKLESRALPTRLVQINKSKNGKPGISANICETQDLPSSTPYATLSHCWGDGVMFRLLKDNIEELKQDIPISQLPKVFQDALYAATEIGVCYIWIDSLCIIQDSEEDWTHEAKRMGDVYLYGEFNIAATGYENGSFGLFNERKALSHVHPPLRFECVLRSEYKSKRSFDGIYVRVSEIEFGQEILSSFLMQRAWVAQERVLSAATLHYTPGKVWWECSHLVANEAFSPSIPIWDDVQLSPAGGIRSLNTKSEREDIYSFWNKFIGYYAGADMTYDQDRFPAAAGIARVLSELIDDNLIAGIWEGDLVRSLVMNRYCSRASIPSVQLAPSWSWASSIADHRIGSDSASVQKSGVRGLAIKGPLRRIMVDLEERSDWLDCPITIFENKRPASFLGVLTKEQMWRWDKPTHMLLLAKQYNSFDSTFWIFGLLVQPVTEADDPNTFRRSGTIQFSFSPEECDKNLGLCEEGGVYQPSLVFEECGLQDLILI